MEIPSTFREKPSITFQLNGKNALNGKLYGMTLHLNPEVIPNDSTIWDVARAALFTAEEESKEMQYPDSLALVVGMGSEPQITQNDADGRGHA